MNLIEINLTYLIRENILIIFNARKDYRIGNYIR
jgi:hypothetical protein